TGEAKGAGLRVRRPGSGARAKPGGTGPTGLRAARVGPPPPPATPRHDRAARVPRHGMAGGRPLHVGDPRDGVLLGDHGQQGGRPEDQGRGRLAGDSLRGTPWERAVPTAELQPVRGARPAWLLLVPGPSRPYNVSRVPEGRTAMPHATSASR